MGKSETSGPWSCLPIAFVERDGRFWPHRACKDSMCHCSLAIWTTGFGINLKSASSPCSAARTESETTFLLSRLAIAYKLLQTEVGSITISAKKTGRVLGCPKRFQNSLSLFAIFSVFAPLERDSILNRKYATDGWLPASTADAARWII